MGGLEKTDWAKAPFVSSYKKFNAIVCMWEDPFPAYMSTTGENWWDQPGAWTLTEAQKLDYAWARRNFVISDYYLDTKRFNDTLSVDCIISLSWVPICSHDFIPGINQAPAVGFLSDFFVLIIFLCSMCPNPSHICGFKYFYIYWQCMLVILIE
jgi:hypothetical protein